MLAIVNGTVVSPSESARADVLIDGGTIAAIEPQLTVPEGAQTLDASDCLVLPGVIDCHVHFNLVSGPVRTSDDFETGSRAAASGGVTCYIDYVTQRQGESFEDAVHVRREEADGKTLVDYGLHFGCVDIEHGRIEELPQLNEWGISSIKIYTTYKDRGLYTDDWGWYTLLRRSLDCGLLIEAHCENDAIVSGLRRQLIFEGKTSFRYHAAARPAIAETSTVATGLALARSAGAASYYVHQSSADSVDRIVVAREGGQPAIAETCPQYLVLTDDAYQGDHPERYILTPPLRSGESAERLWRHLGQGHIACVGSDHAGYPIEGRLERDDFTVAAPGIPGTELILTLLYSEGVEKGRISLQQLVALVGANPARVFGLSPDKGELRTGADADVVIFDPSHRWTVAADALHSATGWTPYEGMDVTGKVRTTISRGTVVYDRGDFPANKNHGRFVKRRPFDVETGVV